MFSLAVAFAADKSAACWGDAADVFSQGVPMPTGANQGTCIDTSAKRAVVLLQKNDTHLTFANFRSQKKFWTAEVPIDSIESVEFIFVDLNIEKLSRWGVNVFHSHLRFRFKKNHPVRLKLQGSPHPVWSLVDDVIVSLNYIGPPGLSYDPVKGLDPRVYLSVLQIYATADEATTRFVEQKLNVYSVPLRLRADQARDLFFTAVLRSHQNQYKFAYNTWTNNCTQDAFKSLDASLTGSYPHPVRPFHFQVWKVRDLNLAPALQALRERSLILRAARPRLLNGDFGFAKFPSRWNQDSLRLSHGQ